MQGAVGSAGNESSLSAQLKHVEVCGSGGFWLRMGDFLTFLHFFVKLGVTGHISRDVMVLVGAGDSVGACVLKTVCSNTLFSCPMSAGGCGELAGEERVNK